MKIQVEFFFVHENWAQTCSIIFRHTVFLYYIDYWPGFYLISQNMIHCYWSARKLGRRLKNKWATLPGPPPLCAVSDLTLYHPNPAFFMGLALTEQGGIGSQKAPTLVIAFNSSWCSSGSEGSVTDTHVRYFLFDLILDELELEYDFNTKQCHRGEEGVVEMQEEVSSPRDVRRN